jgi:hypothetical protein
MRHITRLNAKWRILLTTLLLLLVCGLALAAYVLPKLPFWIEQNSMSYRALWAAKGAANYQIQIVTGSPPAPPVGWELTVQNGQITRQSIIACDHPSEEYPASNCDTIRQYYSSVGKYTIAQLFALAEDGLGLTQNSLLKCNLSTGNNFRSFSTLDEMRTAAQTCQNYLQSSDVLYAVQYDPDYGYPKTITEYTPSVFDGSMTIEVKDFRVIQ